MDEEVAGPSCLPGPSPSGGHSWKGWLACELIPELMCFTDQIARTKWHQFGLNLLSHIPIPRGCYLFCFVITEEMSSTSHHLQFNALKKNKNKRSCLIFRGYLNCIDTFTILDAYNNCIFYESMCDICKWMTYNISIVITYIMWRNCFENLNYEILYLLSTSLLY